MTEGGHVVMTERELDTLRYALIETAASLGWAHDPDHREETAARLRALSGSLDELRRELLAAGADAEPEATSGTGRAEPVCATADATAGRLQEVIPLGWAAALSPG